MEHLLLEILKGSGLVSTATVVVLAVGFSKLAYTLYKGERSKIDRTISTVMTEQKVLKKDIEAIVDISNANREAISVLDTKYEQLKADHIQLQARLLVLDTRVSELAKDMHIGFSDMKTVLIQLFGQRKHD